MELHLTAILHANIVSVTMHINVRQRAGVPVPSPGTGDTLI